MDRPKGCTDGGVQYFGIAIAFDHYTRMNQLSAPYVDPATGKTLLETDKWKRLVSNVVRFYDIPGNVVTKENVSFKVQRDLFLKNAVAMMVFGNVVTEDQQKQG
ncbi:MAG: hypothetical protein K0Q94_5968 [Paenibacillus sp.]|jgi:multiple sugar transport system substrate-binding protein|nr:hypothetical protein [Paenibacillus sp.]